MGKTQEIIVTLASIFAFISLTKMPFVVAFIASNSFLAFALSIAVIMFSKPIARALGDKQ